MTNKDDEKIALGCIILFWWLVRLGFIGVIIWAIIALVLHFTR